MNNCTCCDNVGCTECENKHTICKDCYEKIAGTKPFNVQPECQICRSQVLLPPYISPIQSQVDQFDTYIKTNTRVRKELQDNPRLSYVLLKSLESLSISGPEDVCCLAGEYSAFPFILYDFSEPADSQAYFNKLTPRNKELFLQTFHTAAKEMYIILTSDDLEFGTLSPYHDFIVHLLLLIWNDMDNKETWFPDLPPNVHNAQIEDMDMFAELYCQDYDFKMYFDIAAEFRYVNGDCIIKFCGSDTKLKDLRAYIKEHDIAICHFGLWNITRYYAFSPPCVSQLITNKEVIDIVAKRPGLKSKDIAKILSESFGKVITAKQLNKRYTVELHRNTPFNPNWKGIYGIPEIETFDYMHTLKARAAVS